MTPYNVKNFQNNFRNDIITTKFYFRLKGNGKDTSCVF